MSRPIDGDQTLLSARELAIALKGHRAGRGWMARCPAHDDRSPSLSITDGERGPLIHCHSGCTQSAVLDALRARGLWPDREERREYRPLPPKTRLEPDRSDLPRRIWREAVDPRNTAVEEYLASRGLSLPDDIAGRVVRFHARCPFGHERLPCMVARYSPIANDVEPESPPTAIHRIRLDRFVGPDRKRSLGPCAGQVVKLSHNEDVSLGLGLSEGIEKGLALIESGWRPIWATVGTSTMQAFPVLAGIEALTVFCDRDEPGREAALACARKWRSAGAEARILQPPAPFKDWDAWWKAATA